MVKYFLYIFTLLPLVLFSAEFQAQVSRNEVGVGESFTLSLVLKEASAKTSPSIEPLRKLFSIHSQQQSSNTVFNNGKISTAVTWKFVLTSQNEGEIVIPALSVETSSGTLSTQPLAVRVVKNPSSSSGSSNDSGIVPTAEVSRANPYKNESVFLTLRLTSRQSLANVQVQKFEVQDAIVEVAGEPVIYEKTDTGIHVGVIEFNYLLTPLKSGPLLIPSIAIQGGIPHRRTMSGRSFFDDSFDPFSLFQGFEQLEPFASSTEEMTLNVQSPIAEVNPWLPAKSLKIQEIWNELQPLQEGEVFTRSFIIEAEGVHSSQLPSLEGLQIEGKAFKVYADKPEIKDEIKNGFLKSYRKEQYTFIPEKSGKLILPEITIAWWDVDNHKKMIASVPSRILTITPEAKVVSNLQKMPEVGSKESALETNASEFVHNPLLYAVIAGLAVLFLGAVLWLVLLQRKMARMLETPKKKKEEVVLAFKPSPQKNEPLSRNSSKREKLDDLNPT